MMMELTDGRELAILNVFGGPESIQDFDNSELYIDRDVLTIRLDTSSITIDECKDIFTNADNTKYLYFYTEENSNGTIVMYRNEPMEGYQLLVSCTVEHELIPSMPGKITRPEYEDVIVVKLAQLTYEEFYGE